MNLPPKRVLAKSVRLLLPLALLVSATSTQAANLYWDTNGATAGSSAGTTADGTWSLLLANPNWSTSAAGNVATGVWTQGSTANFSAGTNATGASLIQLSSQRMDVAGINFNQGDVTVSNTAASGTLGFAGAFTIFTQTGASGTLFGSFMIVQAGGGTYTGSMTKTGGGTFTLDASLSDILNATFDGGTTILKSGVGTSSSVRIGNTTNTAVTINPGGSASVNLNQNGQGIVIGVNAGVTGTVDVSGGQMSTSAGNLVIGSAGIGIVNVNSGGNVFVTDPQLVLASAPGSSGTLNLNSGGRLTVTARPNGIMAGSGTAVFNLAGGKIQLFDKGYAGLTSSVPMTLSNTSTIDTAGVSATLSGTLSGSGSLTKISGGTLTLSNQHTYTGDTIVDGGSLALTGAASAITANHSLFIGNDAAGILDLSAGASVTTTSIARLGGNAAGNGTGNIDGAALHVGDYLEVGSLGIGALNVTNGGSVTANTTIAFGVSGASSGTGTVTGAGSNLSAGTTLYVGYGSSGTLTVGSGGSISAGNIVLGATSGGGSGALVLNPGGR